MLDFLSFKIPVSCYFICDYWYILRISTVVVAETCEAIQNGDADELFSSSLFKSYFLCSGKHFSALHFSCLVCLHFQIN